MAILWIMDPGASNILILDPLFNAILILGDALNFQITIFTSRIFVSETING